MFDLEKAIAEWRRKMAAGGVNSPEILDELESHLREDLAERINAGSNVREGFDRAVRQIGSASALKWEFIRAGVRALNWRFAIAAWTVFGVSFFLPSYSDGYFSLWGWQCATSQSFIWGVGKLNWVDVHYELLTFANLVMLASPPLLFWFGRNACILRWTRALTLVSLILVWSFIALFFIHEEWRDLRVGCFVWGASFALLLLSTIGTCRKHLQNV